MKFSQIIFLIFFFVLLTSCQTGAEQKRGFEPGKKAVPSTEHQKTEKSFPELKRQNPAVIPLDHKVKKTRLKAMDTLKPVTAIP